jgi:hypothetical protein
MKRTHKPTDPKGKKCVTEIAKLHLTHSLEIETEGQLVALQALFRLFIVHDTTDEGTTDELPESAR